MGKIISNEKLEKKQPHITPSTALKKEAATTNEKKTDTNNTPDIIFEPTADQVLNDATPEEQYEVQDWMIARGYISDLESDYSTYSAKTLKELADAGDAYANLVISTKLLQANKDELAMPYLYEDSINGYTNSMRELGHIYKMKFTRSFNIDNSTDNSNLLEGLAWYEVARLRGDPFGEGADRFINHEKEPFRITENEYNEIQTRAQNIYSELQEKRTDRELGLFDDSTPEILINAFSKRK